MLNLDPDKATIDDVHTSYHAIAQFYKEAFGARMTAEEGLKLQDLHIAYSAIVWHLKPHNFSSEDEDVKQEKARRKKERGRRRFDDDYSFVNEEFF